MSSSDTIDLDDCSISIEVETTYLEDQLPEEPHKFVFSYKVAIKNNGPETVQLLNRYWLITDGNGNKSEVQGQGVVGKQPYIEPGKTFFYASGAVLETPVNTMQGYYEMQRLDSSLFRAAIPVFSLAVPNSIN